MGSWSMLVGVIFAGIVDTRSVSERGPIYEVQPPRHLAAVLFFKQLDGEETKSKRMRLKEGTIVNPRRKKRYGRCRICQNFRRLTKEHVPPESAFNDRGYLEYYVAKSNEAERIRWETRDVDSKGIYLFTLCEPCNIRTGALYGADYLKFVRAFSSVATPENARLAVTARVEGFFPARVIKQAISMMLSTSDANFFNGYERVASPLVADDTSLPPEFSVRPTDVVRLRGVYERLQGFVLDKNSKGLPDGVRLYAYAVANEGTAIRTGIGIQARLSTQEVHWVVVVGLWPIHWVLLLNGDPLGEEVTDLTDWANFAFKTKRTENVQIPCQWSVGKYPLDFRSPQEFQRDHFINLMQFEGFRPAVSADDEQTFRSAVSFARVRGKWTREGYLMTEFPSGTYYEAYGQRGWCEGFDRNQARELVRAQLNQIK
jgi:hypothetical protein